MTLNNGGNVKQQRQKNKFKETKNNEKKGCGLIYIISHKLFRSLNQVFQFYRGNV